MGGEEHVVCLNRRSDEEARKWDDWQAQTLDKILVDEGLQSMMVKTGHEAGRINLH